MNLLLSVLTRQLEYMDVFGQQITNEFDCPLLSMTNTLYCIPSKSVNHAVSVVHECTNSCTLVTSSVSRIIEHEHIESSLIIFKHDFCNKMYCLNVYCIDV